MSRNPSLVVEAILNGTDINHASRSIINMETYITINVKSNSLTYINSKLRTYLGDVINPER